MLKFMDVFGRWEAARPDQLEAAKLLGWANGRSAVGPGATTQRARPTCWIAGSARHLADGCRWTDARRSSTCIGRSIRGSPHALGSAEVIHPFHLLRGNGAGSVVLKLRTVSGVETLMPTPPGSELVRAAARLDRLGPARLPGSSPARSIAG